MSPRTLCRLATLVVGLTLLLAGALPAGAGPQPAEPDRADTQADEDEERSPISLRLTPAVLEVPLERGPSTHILRLHNTGSQPLTVHVDTTEFTVTSQGATRFAGPEEVGAAGWISLDDDAFELAPDERLKAEVTVDVPEDAEPGERYVSVVFAVPGSAEDGNVVVTHRVAAKLYIEVPGRQIEHIDFGELSGPRLVDSSAATFELEIHNRGNVHRRFEEPERLMATSGVTEFPFQNFTILGDSTRIVEAVWPDPPTVCWCTVEVAADDGRGNLVTASTRVLVFPVRITAALLALTVGVGMLAAARRRRQAAKLDASLTAAHAAGAATVGDAQPPPPDPAPAWQANGLGATAASTSHDGPGRRAERERGPRQPLARAVSRGETSAPVASGPSTVGSQFGTPMFTAHGPPRRRRSSR